jgi:hypothetical protein
LFISKGKVCPFFGANSAYTTRRVTITIKLLSFPFMEVLKVAFGFESWLRSYFLNTLFKKTLLFDATKKPSAKNRKCHFNKLKPSILIGINLITHIRHLRSIHMFFFSGAFLKPGLSFANSLYFYLVLSYSTWSIQIAPVFG